MSLSRTLTILTSTLLVACSGGGDGSSPRPSAQSVVGTTVSGADNDVITVVFSRGVVEAQAETAANWTVESPIGTTFDMTNATIDYVPATLTATVTLGTGTVGTAADANNLQTWDSIAASFAGIVGLNGRPITSTTIGAGAVNSIVAGDTQPPTVLTAFSDDVATTAHVRFSEPCKEVLFINLYTGVLGNAGERFILTDQNDTPAVAATGSVTLTGQPADADTLVINDATQTVTFEFDSNASVVETPTLRQVVIGVDSDATTAALAVAINSGAFTFDITATPALSVTSLAHDNTGTAGNLVITNVGVNVTLAGMTGGAIAIAAPIDPAGGGFAWDADDEGIVLDYTPNVPNSAGDTIEIYGVFDLAGNQAFAVTAETVNSEDLTVPALDTGVSVMAVVSGESNDTLTVNFDRDMSPHHITEPSNYTAAPLDLSGATFAFDGSQALTITLDSAAQNIQFGTNYNLTLVQNAATPLTSEEGVVLPGNDVEVVAGTGDNTAILLGGMSAYVGDAGNPSSCIVVFPEAIGSTGAAAIANYAITATNATAATVLTPTAVRLTFAAAPIATDTLDVQPAAATDLGGTAAAGVLSVVIAAADATAPTATIAATAVAGLGGDFLTVTFDEPVSQAAALTLANYAFTVGGSAVDLTSAAISHNSLSDAITIWLPATIDVDESAAVTAVVSNIGDLSGNALAVQPAGVTVGGDTSDPDFSSAYVNWIADGTGQTVDVLFDEDIVEAFVETPGNWSASLGTPIVSATLIAPNIARVVTTGQIGAAETLDITGLLDPAGNASAAITINPHE